MIHTFGKPGEKHATNTFAEWEKLTLSLDAQSKVKPNTGAHAATLAPRTLCLAKNLSPLWPPRLEPASHHDKICLAQANMASGPELPAPLQWIILAPENMALK